MESPLQVNTASYVQPMKYLGPKMKIEAIYKDDKQLELIYNTYCALICSIESLNLPKLSSNYIIFGHHLTSIVMSLLY